MHCSWPSGIKVCESCGLYISPANFLFYHRIFYQYKNVLSGFYEEEGKNASGAVLDHLCAADFRSSPDIVCNRRDVLQSAKDMLLAAVYGAGNPVRKTFSVKPIGAIWFLWATFWASMMLRYLVTCRRWIRIIVVAVVFVSSFYSANVIWLPFSLQAGGCALLFLYLGYLLRKMGSFIKSLDKEVKIIAFLAAVFIWCYAIRHFAGFYLVHCRIPNGVIDVLGSIGGCLVLIELSKQIVRYTSHISGILVFAGKYSLLFLCIHLVELSGFPWGYLVRYILAVVQLPSEKIYYMMVVMILKVTFIFCTAHLATKSKMVLKLFGFVPLRESVSQCGQSNTGLLK